jgi:hypothetical protein
MFKIVIEKFIKKEDSSYAEGGFNKRKPLVSIFSLFEWRN